MATIPLEDNFIDILGKAQRGLKLTDEQVAQKAGVSPADVANSKSGILNESQLESLRLSIWLRILCWPALGNRGFRSRLKSRACANSTRPTRT